MKNYNITVTDHNATAVLMRNQIRIPDTDTQVILDAVTANIKASFFAMNSPVDIKIEEISE